MLIHKSLESRVKRGWCGLSCIVGRKMMVGLVYVNPEEMRIRDTERPFEVL